LKIKKNITLTLAAVAVVIVAVIAVVFLTDSENNSRSDSDVGQTGAETSAGSIGDASGTDGAEHPVSAETVPASSQDSIIRSMRIMDRYYDRELLPLEYITVSQMKTPLGVSEIFLEEGFLFEITHVAVVGNMIYLFYTLDDLIGGRFDEFTTLFANIRTGEHFGFWGFSASAVNIGVNELGIPAFRSRLTYASLVESQEFNFELWNIDHSHRFYEYDLIDLSQLAPAQTVGYVFNTPILQPHTNLYSPAKAGFDVQEPISLSAVGIVDGRLHVQVRTYPFFHEWTSLPSQTNTARSHIFLIDPMGNIVHPRFRPFHPFDESLFSYEDEEDTDIEYDATEDGAPIANHIIVTDFATGAEIAIFPLDEAATVRFRLDHFGNIVPEEYLFLDLIASHIVTESFYEEMVFDVDMDRLSEYRLIAGFESFYRMNMNWTANFDIYVSEKIALFADVYDITLDLGDGVTFTIEEAIVVPTGVIINGYLRSEDFHWSSAPLFDIETYINTSDNVFQTILWGLNQSNPQIFGFDGSVSAEFNLFYGIISPTGLDFLSPDSIMSIDINGHILSDFTFLE